MHICLLIFRVFFRVLIMHVSKITYQFICSIFTEILGNRGEKM